MEEEEIVKELYEALVEARSNMDLLTTASSSPPAAVERELLDAIIDFTLAYAEAAADESSTKATPDKTFSKQEIGLALDKVKRAKYVTPGDLTRIANSVHVGSFKVKKPRTLDLDWLERL